MRFYQIKMNFTRVISVRSFNRRFLNQQLNHLKIQFRIQFKIQIHLNKRENENDNRLPELSLWISSKWRGERIFFLFFTKNRNRSNVPSRADRKTLAPSDGQFLVGRILIPLVRTERRRKVWYNATKIARIMRYDFDTIGRKAASWMQFFPVARGAGCSALLLTGPTGESRPAIRKKIKFLTCYTKGLPFRLLMFTT